MKATITGFLDLDGQQTFAEQLEIAVRHEIEEVALRYYNSQPLLEISKAQMKDIQAKLKAAKIKVSVIDTLIKPYDLHSDQKAKIAFEEFQHLVLVANALKVNYLFVRLPIFDQIIENLDLVKKRMEPWINHAARNRKRLIFVPDSHHKANTYAYLFKKMRANHVFVHFDPVYFLNEGESTTTAYRILKKKIFSVSCHDQDYQGRPKLIGYGKTNIISLFKRLIRDRFQGFLFIDNRFQETMLEQPEKKRGFFRNPFSRKKKKDQKEMDQLSKIIFTKDATKNVTYDDILDNQIKVLNVVFKK